jgi:hypothetical protein
VSPVKGRRLLFLVNKGLPAKYAKMGFKKGWAAYKRRKTRYKKKHPSKYSKALRGGNKTAGRKAKAKKYVKQSAGPLFGFGTFALGAYGGEYLTNTKLRPWMTERGMGETSQGAALLIASYFTRRFTNRRGIKNAGTGAAAFMAAKGVGLLMQGLGTNGFLGMGG